LSDESYIPFGLPDNIVPYTFGHLIEDKRVQPICHCQYIHLGLSWMDIIHTDHLVDIVGMNGTDLESQLQFNASLMGACNEP
jgi:hypothetical protein